MRDMGALFHDCTKGSGVAGSPREPYAPKMLVYHGNLMSLNPRNDSTAGKGARYLGVQGIAMEYPRRFFGEPNFHQIPMRERETKNEPAQNCQTPGLKRHQHAIFSFIPRGELHAAF